MSKNQSERRLSLSGGRIHSIGMNHSRLTSPTALHSSAAREMGRRQCELARRGAIATIGAADAAVIIKLNMAT